MGVLSLLLVASMPVLQFLIIGLLGAFLASSYINILTPSAMKDINKASYVVFTPALVFASLAKTVTLNDILSWWYMPVNIGIIFLIGGVLGWITVKILKPAQHLEGLIIANCSAGNLGNLLLIVIPVVCDENGSPFGDHQVCHERGLSYASLSMALGNFFIWTIAYGLIQKDGVSQEKMIRSNGNDSNIGSQQDQVLKIESGDQAFNDQEAEATPDQQIKVPLLLDHEKKKKNKFKEILHQLVEELMTPPIISAIVGFITGVIPWLKSLFIGTNAPLKVLQDSIALLGDGLIPCLTLILGGNLTKGLGKGGIKPTVIATIIGVRYIVLPIVGISVVRTAKGLGLLPQDPLFAYVLMIQYTLPPAMSIGTIAQLFDVGREECSVIFLWTYLFAALAITFWSTVFMLILT